MNHTRNVALAVVAVVIVVALLRSPAQPPPDSATLEPPAPKAEVAYPPALFSYSEPLPAAPVASASTSPDMAELCGFGKVDSEQIPAALEAAADMTLVRVVDEFVRARDPRKRALGLATQAWIDAEAADRRVMAQDPKKCLETPLCDEQIAEAFARAATPSIEALAKLAINTQDPQVYVTAMRACRSIIVDSPPSICSSLTLDQWAQVDPDNAMVWMLQARAARMRKDMIGFEDALQRAAHAKFFDRRPTPYGEILAKIDEPSQPVRTLAVGRLADADARHDPGEFYSNFTNVMRHCGKQSELGRRELCNDLAHVLLELSSDSLAVEVAAGFADNGWAERIAKARKRPWHQVPGQSMIADLSCSGAARMERRLLDLARRD